MDVAREQAKYLKSSTHKQYMANIAFYALFNCITSNDQLVLRALSMKGYVWRGGYWVKKNAP